MATSGFGYTKYPCRLLIRLRSDTVLDEISPKPTHCILVPRLRVSPLRVTCQGMGIETSNRAVRQFTIKPDFSDDMFLRVALTEENSGPLNGSQLTETVKSRFRKGLVEGINLCGRKYVFLAYSSSQFTEHSAWMVAPPRGWNVARMRSELGNFSKCKTPSKLGARLGQCFSTTFTHSIRSPPPSHFTVPDIHCAKGCHSDGTGLITRKALNNLLLELPIGPRDAKDVSIIQIRYGGAKGTLTAFDEPTQFLPAGTPRADVYIRDSMIKFEGAFSCLEVCSVGKNVPYFLNRNVILLLVAHGISAETFLNMQKQMLDDLDQMLREPKVAERLVLSLPGPGSDQRSTLLDMLSAGISPATEPFLYDCLWSIRNHQLNSLQKKSRIWVEKGSVLVGGLDETGKISEGEVFFQVDKKPFVGPVLVTKHPVMHPGDVRMMKAVNIPELRKHRNMIIFSKHGDRPAADKMSGSDLDGDEFAVTWDERLFLKGNRDPMGYEGKDSAAISDLSGEPEVITDKLVEHFLDHIKNASIGQISMLWLDHAVAKGAADCQECIELAELHSVAVDYPKSGVPAVIPKYLKLDASVWRAHWREKKGSPSYHCESVIGKLYDQVKGAKHHNNSRAIAGRKVDKYGTIICEARDNGSIDALRAVYNSKIPMALMASRAPDSMNRLSTSLQELANEERECYEEELVQIMNKYKIRGEGETFTGCIRKYHKLYKKKQHDFAQEIRRQCDEIRRKYRRLFFNHVVWISEMIEKMIENRQVDVIAQALASFQFDDAHEDHGFDVHDADSVSQASIDDERLREVQDIAIKSPDLCTEEEKILQGVAFGLAAAFYDASYHPDHRWAERDRLVTLFSFPWLVADVIVCAYGSYDFTNGHRF